jgi:hypothetical protein
MKFLSCRQGAWWVSSCGLLTLNMRPSIGGCLGLRSIVNLLVLIFISHDVRHWLNSVQIHTPAILTTGRGVKARIWWYAAVPTAVSGCIMQFIATIPIMLPCIRKGPRFFVGFLSLSRHMPIWCLKLGYKHFLPDTLQFMIHYHTIIRRYIA